MYSMIQHITLGDEIKISRPVFNLNVNKNCPPRNNKIPNTIQKREANIYIGSEIVWQVVFPDEFRFNTRRLSILRQYVCRQSAKQEIKDRIIFFRLLLKLSTTIEEFCNFQEDYLYVLFHLSLFCCCWEFKAIHFIHYFFQRFILILLSSTINSFQQSKLCFTSRTLRK